MKLQESLPSLELKKNKDNRQQALQKALFYAFERTKSEPFDITLLVKDVLEEFPRVKETDLISAIRNGGLGMYGRTFRLSTQEVCYWIRQYTNPKQQEKL
jgi:hypothetical protein